MNADTHFSLTNSWLCLDCEEVSQNSRTCPACAHGSMMSLAGALNRTTADQRDLDWRRSASEDTPFSAFESAADGDWNDYQRGVRA